MIAPRMQRCQRTGGQPFSYGPFYFDSLVAVLFGDTAGTVFFAE